MEEIGIIKQRVTILDRTKLGLDFEVFVAVKLALPNRTNMEKFAVDFMLRVVTKDMHSYEDFLREVLLSIDLISDVQSRIVLRQTKESYSIPLNLISSAVPRL